MANQRESRVQCWTEGCLSSYLLTLELLTLFIGPAFLWLSHHSNRINQLQFLFTHKMLEADYVCLLCNEMKMKKQTVVNIKKS